MGIWERGEARSRKEKNNPLTTSPSRHILKALDPLLTTLSHLYSFYHTMPTTCPRGWRLWKPRRIYSAEGENLLQKVKSQLGVLYCPGMSSVSPLSPAHPHLWTLISPTFFLDCTCPSISTYFRPLKSSGLPPRAASSMKCFPIHKSEQISPSWADTDFLDRDRTHSLRDATLHVRLSSLLTEGLGFEMASHLTLLTFWYIKDWVLNKKVLNLIELCSPFMFINHRSPTPSTFIPLPSSPQPHCFYYSPQIYPTVLFAPS